MCIRDRTKKARSMQIRADNRLPAGVFAKDLVLAIIESGRTDIEVVAINDLGPVSYTHLDVYKRQPQDQSCGARRCLEFLHFIG